MKANATRRPRNIRRASGSVTPVSPSSARRILLAVAGLSPQVITETIYVLAVAQDRPWIPNEVRLITTSEGADRARLALLSDEPGWFHRLLSDYKLPAIRFAPEHIHVLKDARGEPLSDIRTPDDAERAADFITATVRELTTDDVELHVSIAGGRKTLGYYLGTALSLFGRPQDRLSHVLVDEPFESSWEFFYPTPYSRIISTRDNKLADTARAKVTLAEIPFVRLRHGLDSRLREGSASFGDVVVAAERALGPPNLTIDLDNKCVYVGGQGVHMPPAQLAFLSWLARRAQEGRPDVECPSDGAPELEYAREYLSEYDHIGDGTNGSTATRLRKGMEKTFFEQTKSRLMRRLKDKLGPEGAWRYGVADDGSRPRRYRINVPAENIDWLGGA